jgi:hypothetical protein
MRRVQLVVWYRWSGAKPSYFQVVDSWRVCTERRELIIGKGMNRIHIPLDNVAHYSPEEYDAE